jgi:uncharacterized PurR-regulated membrane protein YhhQ (DUF165 family)
VAGCEQARGIEPVTSPAVAVDAPTADLLDAASWRAVAALVAYLGCIVGANAALNAWGMVHVAGQLLPAGVWFAGLSFTMRDVIDDLRGRTWVLGAIVAGGALSFLFAPSFALASAAAFLLSEGLDWSVYRPLRDRQWGLAVVASNVVGSVADSLLFLWLAFGSPSGWLALTVAKALVTLPFLPVAWWWGRRR